MLPLKPPHDDNGLDIEGVPPMDSRGRRDSNPLSNIEQFTFERHIRSISSVAQKICLLRKSFRIFGDHDVLLRCFNSFILPCLEYCSPVWSSAADSHLELLDKNLRACKFLIPNLTISLQHRRFISSLCMLYKIFHNPSHPLHSELPNLFHPRRVTKRFLEYQ